IRGGVSIDRAGPVLEGSFLGRVVGFSVIDGGGPYRAISEIAPCPVRHNRYVSSFVALNLQFHQKLTERGSVTERLLEVCCEPPLANNGANNMIRAIRTARNEVGRDVERLILDSLAEVCPFGGKNAFTNSLPVNPQLISTFRRHVCRSAPDLVRELYEAF